MSEAESGFATQSGSASVAALIELAGRLHFQRKYQEALRLITNCLNLAPRNAALWNFAGVCAAELDRHGQAERCWRRAISIDPTLPEVHFNLGLMFARTKRADEAELFYRREIALHPHFAQAHCNLGNLLDAANRSEEAQTCYRAAIESNPGFAAGHHNLGNLLMRQGRLIEAEQCYRRTIALAPSDVGALTNMGLLLAKRGETSEAEQCYRRGTALEPQCVKAITNLGLLLTDSKRFDDAELCFRQAIAIDPASAEIFLNLGNLLVQCHREDEAERCYRQAIALDTRSAAAHSNLGVLLANLGRDEEAEACFRQALACNPRHAMGRINLGYLLLAHGRWAEGWSCHEARYVPDMPDKETIYPAFDFVQWKGEPLEGRSLLVWLEQGFGDVIQFCRYISLLKAQGAAHITLMCRPPLKPLLETLAGADALLGSTSARANPPRHDYWTFLLSIPFHCKTTPQSIPAVIPYLHAPAHYRTRWSSRVPADGFRVGLVWKGHHMHGNDAERSLPGLSTLAPLWSTSFASEVNFISLQKGRGEDEIGQALPGLPLLHLGSEIADFADTAAIVELLDLIICVDTAIAHLAGALGKPCWVMLPAYKTDWRWMKDRVDSPWYPHSMRLFRQSRRGDWGPVIADVASALAEEIAKHRAGQARSREETG